MRNVFLLVTAGLFPWVVTSIISEYCHKKGPQTPAVKCTSVQYIHLHSVKTQEANDSCLGNGTWSKQTRAAHEIWLYCNLRRERCTNLSISSDKYNLIRIEYTCVTDLTNISQIDMCSDIYKNEIVPFYIKSPGYPKVFTYNKTTNCTCKLSSDGNTNAEFSLTVFDMLTSLPESLRLRFRNGSEGDLTTASDGGGSYTLNYDVTSGLSDVLMAFKPNFVFPTGQGLFWIGVNGTDHLSVTCNGGITPTTMKTIPRTQTTTPNTYSTTNPLGTVPLTSQPPTPPASADEKLTVVFIVVPLVVIIVTVGAVVAVIIIRRLRLKKRLNENPYESPMAMGAPRADVYDTLNAVTADPTSGPTYYNIPPPVSSLVMYENLVTGGGGAKSNKQTSTDYENVTNLSSMTPKSGIWDSPEGTYQEIELGFQNRGFATDDDV